MSFANLVKSMPPGGKIQIKGGLTQGHVKKPPEKITVDKYTPSLGKGSEYAAKFRIQEELAYMQAMAARENEQQDRVDVTSPNGASSSMFLPEELTSIGTLPNVMDLNNEELTQVYNNYEFTAPKPSEHLEPIRSEQEKILQIIESNQVCIIKGPTGCGKSTQIPQFILDLYVKKRAHCNIVVTQPRRIAAISLAQRVCEERDWTVGSLVGYQVGLEKTAGEDTRLLYCTTGVLLEKLINKKSLTEYTHIILDEVHEREGDMDMTMLVVKYFLRNLQAQNVKVILMSATMDVTRFAKYFQVILRNERQLAPYYDIGKDRKFNVRVAYLEELKNLGILPEIKEDEPGIAPEAYALVPLMIRAFNHIDEVDYQCRRCADEKGAVLIFLPGLHQIETLHDLLKSEDEKHPGVFNFWLCPLHSSITKDEQNLVRLYPPKGKRKVILSTNIAESSITIKDVKYVIDFCLTKHLVSDPVTGFSSLQLAWASHTNCIQREGRAGRVQDGRVYRMVRKDFYLLKMSKECVPEMQRCPLDIIVLKCKKLMEDVCPLRLISMALDPPDLTNYEKTILKLKEIGALLTTCRGELDLEDGDLTFMGRVMASLPLDIRITKLILLGHIFDLLDETIVIGCAMTARNIFSEPFQKRLEAYNNKLLWADSSESDLIAYLNAYMVWRQSVARGKFKKNNADISWAKRYMLQIKNLNEIAKQEEDIRKRLKFMNIEIIRRPNKELWTPAEKPLILKVVLAGAFYPHYFLRSCMNPNVEGDAVKTLSGHDPYTCVYMQNMPQPGVLYEDQLREKLNKISDDFKIHYEDSGKVIVEFNKTKDNAGVDLGTKHLHANIPGDIVMPVYRAIKMRQLRLPLYVKTKSSSVASEELKKFNEQTKVSQMSQVSEEEEYKPMIRLDESALLLEIVHVENAGTFYAVKSPWDDRFRKVVSILGKPKSLARVSGNVDMNCVYAAPFRESEEDDVRYYRAKILKKRPLPDNQICYVDVYYLDYGNVTTIPINELRKVDSDELQEELEKIPPLAIRCVLAEVAPSAWSEEGAIWSKEASTLVRKTLLDKSYTARVYSYVEGTASVFLFLTDNKKPSDKLPPTLNDLLVQQGYARHREENYLSKLNHRRREEVVGKLGVEYSSTALECETSVDKSFVKSLSYMPTITNYRPIVDLKGPNSPLEMKLFSMIHCSSQKEVHVDGASVNSVLLDSDPSDPHERLLVAGSVSQSPDGRKLTLNQTTVLPNMHGLAALICLIFAPAVELRTDENLSRYTGALCGLGAMQNTLSLFRENDMEITFDVEFIDEDLLNVNKLRYWINERYCSDDAENSPDHLVMKIQENVKKFTMSLLTRVRRSIRVHNNPYAFMWGRVPKHLVLQAVPEFGAEHLEKFIYRLHNAIHLNPKNDRREIEDLVHKMEDLEQAVMSNMPTRFMKCELCEVEFSYFPQLRLHVTTRHHQQLSLWLRSRAAAHEIHFRSPQKQEPPKHSQDRALPLRLTYPSKSPYTTHTSIPK